MHKNNWTDQKKLYDKREVGHLDDHMTSRNKVGLSLSRGCLGKAWRP